MTPAVKTVLACNIVLILSPSSLWIIRRFAPVGVAKEGVWERFVQASP